MRLPAVSGPGRTRTAFDLKDKHLKLRRSGRIAIAALATVTAFGLSACGSGEKTAKPVKASATKTAAAQAYPATPSTADLNSAMQKVLDPSVPDAEKLDLMQGMQADPNLPSRIIDAYKQNNASIVVTNVTDLGNGTLTADAQAAINGGAAQQAVVPFIAEDGKWKVQKEWICNLLSLGNQTSPACS
ncbi:hypothetical protein [Nocardia inohanensis]|uniref:hypothetical protein n=1 Tax=Nocardia inohanensis TaxID=209246 RepID=UPI001FE084CE|nr:hypothetical protein [Nocardia inohanensis]